jgi:hypothetical protein
MRVAAVAVLVSWGVIAGCASGGNASPTETTPEPTAAVAEQEAPEAPAETAGDALKRQLQLLSEEQLGELYDELHPEQQKLFTSDQFRCQREALGRLEVTSVEIVDEYPDRIQIPGTGIEEDATAVSARVSVVGLGGLQTGTDTFHQFAVDGKWTWTVPNPQDFASSKIKC